MKNIWCKTPVSVWEGDILDCPHCQLVVPVNTVGVMGAGLAKKVANRYSKIHAFHESVCEAGDLKIGKPLYLTSLLVDVVLFPTKQQWQDGSRIEWIRKGLKRMYYEHSEASGHWIGKEPPHLAIPALGCGLGGLSWSEVRSEIISNAFFFGVDTSIVLYDEKHIEYEQRLGSKIVGANTPRPV